MTAITILKTIATSVGEGGGGRNSAVEDENNSTSAL